MMSTLTPLRPSKVRVLWGLSLLGVTMAFVSRTPSRPLSCDESLHYGNDLRRLPIRPSPRHPRRTRLRAANEPNWDSNNAFEVLGLDPSPNLDKKDIKRAYKRMALKYHPDVSEDKDKKRASDRFAKINWAYQTLMGKDVGSGTASSSTASSSSSRSSSTGGWTPPHRRPSSSYGSSSSGDPYKSTDWRDFMPNYEKEDYDAGGDSFGAIFSDLFTGVAGAAMGAGGGGVFRDFVEFLENNVDGGYTGGDDAALRLLLQTGSVEEIGDEMDDTELVVRQLSAKLKTIQDDLIMLQAEMNAATRYSERIGLEERISELQARKSVVDGYIKKSQKRLLSLQSRYKELIVGGDNDYRVGGRSGSSTSRDPAWDSSRSSSSSSSTSSSASSSSSSSRSRASSTNPEDAWKDDSFGSFGRGRGSSRSRSRRSSRTSDSGRTTSGSQTSSASTSGGSYRSSSSYSSGGASERRPSESVRSTSYSSEPPHRRPSWAQQKEDQERLRELKVDEEFDKLKKELGL